MADPSYYQVSLSNFLLLTLLVTKKMSNCMIYKKGQCFHCINYSNILSFYLHLKKIGIGKFVSIFINISPN